MVQAAAEGVVDFSKVAFGSKRWRLYLEPRLLYLQNRNRREYLSVLHRTNSSLLGSGIVSAESFERLREASTDIYNEIVDTYYPSVAKPKKDEIEIKSSDIQKATEMWESAFGDLDDPEVSQRVQELADALLGLKPDTFARKS
jgi:hypothetical protein